MMNAEIYRQLIISHFDLIKNPRKGFQEISTNIGQLYSYINPLVEIVEVLHHRALIYRKMP